MRALVTGGAGFIGSHLVDALVAAGDEVHVVDDLSTGHLEHVNPAATLHRLDAGGEQARDLIAQLGPAVIHHLAGNISVPRSIAEPDQDAIANVAATARLMATAARAGAVFVLASSAAVYSPEALLPAREDDAGWPVTPYGAGKLAAELYLHALAAQTSLRYTALRFSNVYGPRQAVTGEGGVVAMFCRALAAGRQAVINGDGEQSRDFVYVADVARAAVLAGERPLNRAVNCSTGIPTTINRVYEALAAAFGSSAVPAHGPAREGDVRESVLDPSLAAELLGWRPEVPVDNGLRETAAWFDPR